MCSFHLPENEGYKVTALKDTELIGHNSMVLGELSTSPMKRAVDCCNSV